MIEPVTFNGFVARYFTGLFVRRYFTNVRVLASLFLSGESPLTRLNLFRKNKHLTVFEFRSLTLQFI
jgi:hypothetical protein